MKRMEDMMTISPSEYTQLVRLKEDIKRIELDNYPDLKLPSRIISSVAYINNELYKLRVRVDKLTD